MRLIVLPFTLFALLLASCSGPLALPTDVRLDAIAPSSGTTGTQVELEGTFTQDVTIEVCGMALESLAFHGTDRAVVAPGVAQRGPGFTRATGIVPVVPVGTACDVTLLIDGRAVEGASITFTTEAAPDEDPVDEEPVDEEPVDEEPVDEEPVEQGRIVATSGTTLLLLEMAASGHTEVATASLPGEFFAVNHAIFGLQWHPTEPLLFVTSLVHQSWGDARIDVFERTSTELAHVGTTWFRDLAIPCAGGGTDACAPTEMTFHPDGTRLYVNEDAHDGIATFDVDPQTGALTYVAFGASVWYQGLTAHPSEPYLYNGLNVISLDQGLPITDGASGSAGGNSTLVLATDAGLRLLTTVENSSVALADLADASAPAEIGRLEYEFYAARALAFDSQREMGIAVGNDVVTTFEIGGGTGLTELAVTPVQPPEGITQRVYRGVAWATGTELAIAAWFAGGESGFTVFQVASDGTVTIVEEIEGNGAARAVLAVR